MAESIFPFIDATVADASVSTETSVPKEYLWDFDKNDFVLSNGKPVIVEGLEAIKIWILKALRTQRYRYLAYTWNYGQEFEDLVGQKFGPEVLKSEAERYLTDTLLINSHIKSISNVSVVFDGSKLSIDFTVLTDQGEVEISV
ncbi:MAG TPA: DUF2634 domain-containing protein [Caproiciproducens sp.]|nr:DUF2634 domain-containing protein [Caproiciproducens sp.]